MRRGVVVHEAQYAAALLPHVVLFLVAVPKADQRVRREPDALPSEEDLQQVVGEHDELHRAYEEQHPEPEPHDVAVALHVARAVYHYEERDPRDHVCHYHRQRVGKHAGLEAYGLYPHYLVVYLPAGKRHREQRERGQRGHQGEPDRGVPGYAVGRPADRGHYQGSCKRYGPDQPRGLGDGVDWRQERRRGGL